MVHRTGRMAGVIAAAAVGGDGNKVATIFYGAHVRAGTYAEHTSHYGILRTVEDMYGLAHAGASATAAPITGVWT